MNTEEMRMNVQHLRFHQEQMLGLLRSLDIRLELTVTVFWQAEEAAFFASIYLDWSQHLRHLMDDLEIQINELDCEIEKWEYLAASFRNEPVPYSLPAEPSSQSNFLGWQ
jgi:hypothetical protein